MAGTEIGQLRVSSVSLSAEKEKKRRTGRFIVSAKCNWDGGDPTRRWIGRLEKTELPDRESKIRAMLVAQQGPGGPVYSPHMTHRTVSSPDMTPGKKIEGSVPNLKRLSDSVVTNNHNKKPKQTEADTQKHASTDPNRPTGTTCEAPENALEGLRPGGCKIVRAALFSSLCTRTTPPFHSNFTPICKKRSVKIKKNPTISRFFFPPQLGVLTGYQQCSGCPWLPKLPRVCVPVAA